MFILLYLLERLAAHLNLHQTIPDSDNSPELNEVTASVNQDGELVITQEPTGTTEGALILSPSLLRVIQSTNEISDQILSEFGGNLEDSHVRQWSIEVIIQED